jgi:hypothetical protein
MQLTVFNTNISNSLNTSTLTVNGYSIANTLTVGANVSVNSSQVTVGSVTVNSTVIATPDLFISGVSVFNGSIFAGIVNTQIFTANGTWTKPAGLSGNEQVFIMMWGGGAGSNTSQGQGGGGGACLVINLLASQCNATCNVYVASGGTAGVSGQTSVFWTNSTSSISAYGGGTANVNTPGGGGGVFSLGLIANGGGPLGGISTVANSTFGGGYGKQDGGGDGVGISIYGGGGGSRSGNGGISIYGGGGGSNNGTVGTSVFGGNGGNNTVAATAPGGGGGGTSTNAPGARGEVRVWVIK